MFLKVSSGNFRNATFMKKSLKVKRSNSLRKMSSWPLKTDPKGTKKPQTVSQPKCAPRIASHSEEKKAVKKVEKRGISLLRSSPPRPRGQRSRESSPNDAPGPASSADLQSPRRAPRIPGLDVSPQPPTETPESMRRRRRSGRGRQRLLRCRNRGCANTERTFSSERARQRHEQETCSMRIQVGIKCHCTTIYALF